MITYELAKKLKDAGFKINEFEMRESWMGNVYIPNLSELIEATKSPDHYFKLMYGGGCWHCESTENVKLECQYLDTPEEAVASLWLALHAKT